MPDHNGGARQIVRAVGDPLARGKLVVRFIRHGKTVVAVLGGVSVTGEMLVYRQNALRGEALRARARHGRGGICVRGKRAAADDGIGGIRIHVRHGREVHREAVIGEIRADRAAHILRFRRAARRAHSGGALILRQTEGGVVRKAGDRAAFLVHAEEHRHRRCFAQLRGKGAERFGIGDVLAEDRDSADRICREHGAHIVRERFHALRFGGIDLPRRLRRVERIRTDEEELPDLFPQRQGLHIALDGVALCRDFCLCRGLCRRCFRRTFRFGRGSRLRRRRRLRCCRDLRRRGILRLRIAGHRSRRTAGGQRKEHRETDRHRAEAPQIFLKHFSYIHRFFLQRRALRSPQSRTHAL